MTILAKMARTNSVSFHQPQIKKNIERVHVGLVLKTCFGRDGNYSMKYLICQDKLK